MQRTVATKPPLLLSQQHACSYLPDKTARMLFINLDTHPQKHIYSLLAAQGFRRSGHLLYRPACENCNSCIPVRIPIDDFRPDKSQRRIWKRNQDLEVRQGSPEFVEEHYRLYQNYMNWRHFDENRMEPSALNYAALLAGHESFFIEFRTRSQLVCVAIADVLENALSAVYTFYSPDMQKRSLGTLSILWQIYEARRRKLHWLYLGYWISACKKMAYKDRFRPSERLTARGWEPMN